MLACQDHFEDILKSEDPSRLSHTGSDQSTYKDRIERYCRWGGSIFEGLDFAPRIDATDIVVAWLVDDGNQKRTHRLQLLKENTKHGAIITGFHPKF